MSSKNKSDLDREAEAKSLISLNRELESILGTSQEKMQQAEEQTFGEEIKARKIISSRGYEVFKYEDVRKEWEQGIPLIRDFQLPLAKPLIKQHVKFWTFFTPVSATFVHLMFHFKKNNSSKGWVNKNLWKWWAGVYAFGFGTSCMHSYFLSPYW